VVWGRGALHEDAEPRYGFADNQILHLTGTFVGVKRFGIRKEARGIVVKDNAVGAEQLPGPGNGLAHPDRAASASEMGARLPRRHRRAFT
jgi:hypothetical protein